MKSKLNLLRVVDAELNNPHSGYSVYENPDKELVEKIKAVPLPTEFKYFRFIKKE